MSLNLALKSNTPQLIFGSPTISRADTDLKHANNFYLTSVKTLQKEKQNNGKIRPKEADRQGEKPLILFLQQIVSKWCLREAIGLHGFPC